MAIDIKKLEEICEGDPEAKVTVRRAWLKEVLRELYILEGYRVKERRKPSNPSDVVDNLMRTMQGRR